MLKSSHPEIRRFVIEYFENANSPIREELMASVRESGTVKHCNILIPTDSNPDGPTDSYRGFLFKRGSQTLALVSDHMDYSQDVLIDVSKLRTTPIVGRTASLDEVTPVARRVNPTTNSRSFHDRLEGDYVKSLFSVCSDLVKSYAELKKMLPLPKLHDPLLSEMIRWKNSNTYKRALMPEYKNTLSKSLNDVNQLNFMLNTQKDIIDYVLANINLPNNNFSITDGDLKPIIEQISAFNQIAKYGLEIKAELTDKGMEFVFSNFQNKEIGRIIDETGVTESSVSFYNKEYPVNMYTLDKENVDNLTYTGTLADYTFELRPVLLSLIDIGDQKGMVFIAKDNNAMASHAQEEVCRLNKQPCVVMKHDGVSSETMFAALSRYNPELALVTKTFAKNTPDFANPMRKAKTQDLDISYG